VGDHQRTAVAEGPAGVTAGHPGESSLIMQQPFVCRTSCCILAADCQPLIPAGLLCVCCWGLMLVLLAWLCLLSAQAAGFSGQLVPHAAGAACTTQQPPATVISVDGGLAQIRCARLAMHFVFVTERCSVQTWLC
jgi:hypothetical protein